MNKKFKFIVHACIKFNFDNLIVYTDPYLLDESTNDADIIFITHGHYDHYSVEDIKKVIKKDTIIILPSQIDTIDLKDYEIMHIESNLKYECKGLKFETLPAYNVDKQFHKKEDGGVGYILEFDNTRYYIAGDTDVTEENRKIICDVAFVPVGGTYTMNLEEAARLINEIKPQIAVPIHYGKVVGSREDAIKFCKLIDKDIIVDLE